MTTVEILRGRGRPSTIARLIRAVVVNAVKCVTGRSAPHVAQERLETVAPSFADGDSSAAPFSVARMRGVEAAGLHAAPRVVLGRAFRAARRAVFDAALLSLDARHVHGSGAVGAKAPATLGQAAAKFVRADQFFVAAIADAAPLSARACGQGNNREAVESVTGRNRRFHSAIIAV